MDSDPAVAFYITGIALSFIFSTVFSCVKVIFYSIDNSTSHGDDDDNRLQALQVESVFRNRPLLSSTVSLGKSLSTSGFALFTYLLFSDLFAAIPIINRIGYTVLFSLFILNLFGHEIPRILSLKYYRSFFNFVLVIYKFFSWLFLPFASLFISLRRNILKFIKYDEKLAFLTNEEKSRITKSDDNEALDDEEKEMIRSIFDLGDTIVDEIMVPRIDIKGLHVDSALEIVLKMIHKESHSRIPVYKETIDSIVGILYAKDILSWLSQHKDEEWDLRSIIKKPHYVPVGKKVNDLMREFKLKHIHLAIVVDEYGGTAGVVTMEDILEEIVGEIQDEYDEEEQEIIKLSENVFLVNPHTDIKGLNEELGLNLELKDSDYNTLSGLIYHEYGDVPQENAEFEFENLKIKILKMDNQRIENVKIEIVNYKFKASGSDGF